MWAFAAVFVFDLFLRRGYPEATALSYSGLVGSGTILGYWGVGRAGSQCMPRSANAC
jgi:hypothetical protein